MARLTHSYEHDEVRGCDVLIVRKSRGKLSIGEITDYLLYEAKLYGQYAILLNCKESCCEGSGWMIDSEEPKGDSAALNEAVDYEKCPICGKEVPMRHCPMCGAELEVG